MQRKKLSEQEIKGLLLALNHWHLKQDDIGCLKLRAELSFKDFVQAFSFMTKVALISEKLDHHPDWSNVYNRVIIELFTHDVGGITETDLKWAKEVESLIENHK